MTLKNNTTKQGSDESMGSAGKSQESLRDVVDNAPVMMWVTDQDQQGTFFNKTWLEFTGRGIDDEKGNGWMVEIFNDDLDRFTNLYNTGFEKQAAFETEYRLRRYDGEYRWVKCIAKPSYSFEGNFIGFIGTVTEIHDQKLTFEELDKLVAQKTRDLQESNQELERTNSELQQFACVASHDLQEPLRKIITFSDRLNNCKDGLPEMLKNYAEK